MPINVKGYLAKRLGALNWSDIQRKDKPSLGFSSGINAPENYSRHDYEEQIQQTADHISKNMQALLAINFYEGILAVAYLLDFPECSIPTERFSLIINSVAEKLKPLENDREFSDALLVILRKIRLIKFEGCILNDELLDVILRLGLHKAHYQPLKFEFDKVIITHAQLLKYIDILSDNLTLKVVSPSVYQIERSADFGLTLVSSEEQNLSITSQEINEILNAKKSKFKQLKLASFTDSSFVIEDDSIESLILDRCVMGLEASGDKFSQFLRGFKILTSLECENITFRDDNLEAKRRLLTTLADFKNLSRLSLQNCGLRAAIDELINIINSSAYLCLLGIRGNEFDQNDGKKIISAIQKKTSSLISLSHDIVFSEEDGHTLAVCLGRNRDRFINENLRVEVLAICAEAESSIETATDTELERLFKKLSNAQQIVPNLQATFYISSDEANALLLRIEKMFEIIKNLWIPAIRARLAGIPNLVSYRLPDVNLDDRVIDELIIPYIKINRTLRALALGHIFSNKAMARLEDAIRETNLIITEVVDLDGRSHPEFRRVLMRNKNRERHEKARSNIEQKLKKIPAIFEGIITGEALTSLSVELNELYHRACKLRNIGYPNTAAADVLLVQVKKRISTLSKAFFAIFQVVSPRDEINLHRSFMEHFIRVDITYALDLGNDYDDLILDHLRGYAKSTFIRLGTFADEGRAVIKQVLLALLAIGEEWAKRVGAGIKWNASLANRFTEILKVYVDAYLASQAIFFEDKEVESKERKVLNSIASRYLGEEVHRYPYLGAFLYKVHWDDAPDASQRIRQHFISCFDARQNFSYQLRVHSLLMSFLLEEKKLDDGYVLRNATPRACEVIKSERPKLIALYLSDAIGNLMKNAEPQDYEAIKAYLHLLYLNVVSNLDVRVHAEAVLKFYLDVIIAMGLNEANLAKELFELNGMAKNLDQNAKFNFDNYLIWQLMRVNNFVVRTCGMQIVLQNVPARAEEYSLIYNRVVQEKIARSSLTAAEALKAVELFDKLITCHGVISSPTIDASCRAFFEVLGVLNDLSAQKNTLPPELLLLAHKAKHKEYLLKIISNTTSQELWGKVHGALSNIYQARILNNFPEFQHANDEEKLLIKEIKASVNLSDLLGKLDQYAERNIWSVRFSRLDPDCMTAKLMATRDEIRAILGSGLPRVLEKPQAVPPAAAAPLLAASDVIDDSVEAPVSIPAVSPPAAAMRPPITRIVESAKPAAVLQPPYNNSAVKSSAQLVARGGLLTVPAPQILTPVAAKAKQVASVIPVQTSGPGQSRFLLPRVPTHEPELEKVLAVTPPQTPEDPKRQESPELEF